MTQQIDDVQGLHTAIQHLHRHAQDKTVKSGECPLRAFALGRGLAKGEAGRVLDLGAIDLEQPLDPGQKCLRRGLGLPQVQAREPPEHPFHLAAPIGLVGGHCSLHDDGYIKVDIRFQ